MVQRGKRLAIADTIRTGESLTAYLQRYNERFVDCCLCESRLEAEKLAVKWNEKYAEMWGELDEIK